MSDPTYDKLTTLTKETFDDLVGETFRLELEGGELALEISETRSLLESQELGPEDRKPFSVIFVAPPEPFLPQAIYHLSHPKLNDLPLFLVPLGPEGQGKPFRYEAVFT
jgi:hypothetical protein